MADVVFLIVSNSTYLNYPNCILRLNLQNKTYTRITEYCTVFFILIFLAVYSPVTQAESIFSAFSSDEADVVSLQAPKSVKAFLEKHVELPKEPFADEMSQRVFVRRINQEVKDLLATRGYFTPTVTLEDQKDGGITTISIDPGPLTRVRSISIEFQGAITQSSEDKDAHIDKLRKGLLIKEGKPFRSQKWEDAKTALLAAVTQKKYAAARILKSEALVDKENAQADLSIVINSGPVFYFGALKISGLERYDQKLVENFKTFRVGEVYNKNDLLAFQVALQGIPHFNNVAVNISTDVTQHLAAPVQVILSEAKTQHVAFGLGFSSNNGARGEVRYSNHNFLNRALNFTSILRIEQKRQTAFAGVNTLPDQNNIYYSLGASLQRTDIKKLETLRERIDLARIYQTQNFQQQLALNWQREEKRPSGALKQSVQALVLDWRLRYQSVDDSINVRKGFVSEFKLGGGVKHVLTDQNFLRMYGRQQMWWPIGKRDVFHLRGEVGYTLAASRSGIPQEYLFRAGGIQSVRGYSFMSIGVREGDAIVGGRYMATGTAEYTHWLLENWGGAVFVDAGSATDSMSDVPIYVGYGAGIRWRSPAGPLALDLARGHKTGSYKLHFSMAVLF